MDTAIKGSADVAPQLSLVDLFGNTEELPESVEPTSPIEAAKQRIDATLDYLKRYGAAPKRAQVVRMLEELSNDLGRLA